MINNNNNSKNYNILSLHLKSEKMKLSIDLGGTNLRIAKIDKGTIVATKAVACPAADNEIGVLNLIRDMIKEYISADIDGIGIGVPSVVDAERGIVYDVVNIPSWKEVHLKELFEKEFKVRVCVDNDVNCFVLGEKFYGKGKPFDNFVGITLGTGVGAGIIIDGKLYRGTNTGAGEVGCLPYLDSDYEHYASSMFLSRVYHSTGKALTAAADNGDKEAIDIWSKFGYHLGKLLQALLFTFDPQAIIIGGGIAAASRYFENEMRLSMAEHFPYTKTIDNVQILFSNLQGSNLLGASVL
jgi:glucokinase